MYSDIRTFIQSAITPLNTGLTIPLSEVSTNLDTAKTSSNETDCSYFIKIIDIADSDTESYFKGDVNIDIELSFLTTNQDTVKYQLIIDSYIFGLMRKIKKITSYKNTAGTFSIGSITKLRLANGNTFINSGEIFKPKIQMTLGVIEDL